MTVSGLVSRHQADVIAYLVEENRVLEELVKVPVTAAPPRSPRSSLPDRGVRCGMGGEG